MRILHIYSGNLFGGVESVLFTFAQHQEEFPQVQQEFALCFEGRLSRELKETDATVHFLGHKVSWSRPWTIWQARHQLRTLIQQHGFNAIICHSPWAFGIFGPVARDLLVPVVFWLHDYLSGKGWIERTARAVKPDLVICNSIYTQTSVKNSFGDLPTAVVHCPVPPPLSEEIKIRESLRTSVRKDLGISDQNVVFTQVSRLERWKGHLLFLEALAGLSNFEGWSALIVGGPQKPEEDAYFDELHSFSNHAGIKNRVFFLGQRADISRLLLACAVVVQPNLAPGAFGSAFVEALYRELPVVTIRGGGADEILTEETGILLNSPDSNLLKTALSDLLINEGKRKNLGKNGPIQAHRVSDPHQRISKTIELVKDLIQSQNSR